METIDITTTPQAIQQMIQLLTEQVKKSEATIAEAESRLDDESDSLIVQALEALVEREHARIDSIKSALNK